MDFEAKSSGFTLDVSIKLVFFTMKPALEMERHVVGCPSVLDGRRKTVPCDEMRAESLENLKWIHLLSFDDFHVTIDIL